MNPTRNKNYQNFYEILYGLPMVLDSSFVNQIGNISEANYNQKACYKIELVLNETLFSNHWNVYIFQENFAFEGMEIVFPEDPTKGERLYFSGEKKIESMRIPRFRHWYEYANNEYSGSDVVL